MSKDNGGPASDRELLEMAAKAAGVELVTPTMIDHDLWNPLDDDGDALRLAVKLELDILRFPAFGEAQVCSQDGVADEAESTSICPYAATRRAIVRAAAAIGSAM